MKVIAILTIDIPDKTLINPANGENFYLPGGRFSFEHSLKAIGKWESKWKIPFLVDGKKTPEQTIDYVLCMCDDDSLTVAHLNDEVVQKISDYVRESHTATTIREDANKSSKIVTSEVLYSYLAVAQIPFDTEDWNLSRLLMLVGAVSAIHSPPKKMTKAQILEQNKRLNEQRKKELGTKG